MTTTEKPMSWRDFERKTEGVTTAGALRVPLHLINIKEGHNPRDVNKPETQAKIQRIKEAYKAGEYVQPIDISLINNVVYIVDGECRFTAASLAHEEMVAEGGDGIANLMCIPFRGNDTDRIIHSVLSNEGEKLTPMEIANNVVKKLINQGWEPKKVATSLKCSVSWIDKLYFLSNMPEAVKTMTIEGKISVDVAHDTVKKHGEGAVAVLEDLVAGMNGKKATTKDAKKQAAATAPASAAKPTPASKPATTPKEKERKPHPSKLIESAFDLSRDLMMEMDDIEYQSSELVDTKVYEIELTGKALKKLIELQVLFTD